MLLALPALPPALALALALATRAPGCDPHRFKSRLDDPHALDADEIAAFLKKKNCDLASVEYVIII